MAAKRVSDNGPKDASNLPPRSLRKRRDKGEDKSPSKISKTSPPAPTRTVRSRAKQRQEEEDTICSPSKRPNKSSPIPSQPSRTQKKRGQEGGDADSYPSKKSKTSSPASSQTSQSLEERRQEEEEQEQEEEADSSPSKRPGTTPPNLSQPLQLGEERREEGEDNADSSPGERPKTSSPAPARPSGSQRKRGQEGEGAENTPNKRPKTGTFQPLSIYTEFIQDRDQILHAIMYDLYDVNKIYNDRQKNKVARLDYEARCIYASRALEKAITCRSWSWDEANMDCEEREASRLRFFAEKIGWPMLAICVQAEAFRRLCQEESTPMWQSVWRRLQGYVYNIWIQAHSRGFEWRSLLEPYAGVDAPRGFNQALAHRSGVDGLRYTHPHEIVVDEGVKTVRPPIFRDRLQKHVEFSTFDPKDWETATDPEHRGLKKDPTLRKDLNHGLCDLCAAGKICECQIKKAPFEFVQLVQTTMGVGVRALAQFEKGDILAEFVGPLHPPCYIGDPVYALTMQGKVRVKEEIALICPMEFGNFTRFINHSCRANTTFERRTIGDRAMMTVEALRDIQPFEELTVNYGRAYWKGRTCECGEEGCYTKQEERKKQQREREMERRKQRDMQLEASKNVATEEDGDTEEYSDEEDEEEDTDEEETDEEGEVEEGPPKKKPEEEKAPSKKGSKEGSSLGAAEGPSKGKPKGKKALAKDGPGKERAEEERAARVINQEWDPILEDYTDNSGCEGEEVERARGKAKEKEKEKGKGKRKEKEKEKDAEEQEESTEESSSSSEESDESSYVLVEEEEEEDRGKED